MCGTLVIVFRLHIFIVDTVLLGENRSDERKRQIAQNLWKIGGFQKSVCFSTETLETTLYLAFSRVMVHNGSMHVQGCAVHIVNLLRKGLLDHCIGTE